MDEPVSRRAVAVRGLTIAGLVVRHAVRRGWAAAGGPTSSRTGLLADLGPAFVKAAQLLSTRHDQLPRSWCDRLGRLLDQVPAPPAREVSAILRGAYGDVLPFRRFDPVPIACGSIATVHRATLPDGREVAVKIRRPGVEATLRTDLALMTGLVRLGSRLPGLRGVPLGEIAGQVGGAIRRQADFAAERRSLRALRTNLACLPYVRVPALIDSLCRDEVIVMSLMTGLRRLRPTEITPADRRAVVVRTLTAMYQMLFADGLVHCDLHPGNVYAGPDNDVVVLDAGFVVPLPDRVRDLFADFFMSMAMGRGRRCGEIVLESAAEVPDGCDRDGFVARIADLVAASTGARAGEFSLGGFAATLFDLQRRHGIYAAPEFAFPLLALLVVEGMVGELDRDLDFQAAAIPVLVRVLGFPQEAAA